MDSIAGMKELNQKLSHIDRSLERIAKALEHYVKIYDRRIPNAVTPVRDIEDKEENEDEMS